MNKTEILNRLKNLKLDKNKYIVISGAALVVRGIIDETPDIDLACNKEFYDNLNWEISLGSAGRCIKSFDCFEISDNFYYDNMPIDIIDGFKFMNIKDILKIKKLLNRPKDQNIIKVLEEMVYEK